MAEIRITASITASITNPMGQQLGLAEASSPENGEALGQADLGVDVPPLSPRTQLRTLHPISPVYTMAKMDNLIISDDIQEKLTNKHHVCRKEVEQCFENRSGGLLQDTREEHKTNPPTMWFISTTNKGRELKVVYIQKGSHIYLRTCYPPNQTEIRIYNKHA